MARILWREPTLLLLALVGASCGGLRLPVPGVAGTSADGPTITYVFENGETLRVPRRRAAQVPSTDPRPCSAELYLELGSATYVTQSLAEEQRRRRDAAEVPLIGSAAEDFKAERQSELETRRTEMGYASARGFIDALTEAQINDDGVPHSKTITCDLTLQPEDRIFTSLRYVGPRSSNRSLTCECEDGDSPRCARLVSPFTVTELHQMAGNEIGEPPVLSFRPSNCGVSGSQDARGALRVSCDPVTGVRVTGCALEGRISAGSFGGDMALYSSPAADHVSRLRASAAQHLTFSDMTIQGRFRTPIHLLPGVHHVTVQRSRIMGGHAYSTIYLPADGGWNTLRDNVILGQSGRWDDLDPDQPKGARREVIAVDSSEHNRIIGNHIQRIYYGGIFLFRNCGERRMLRQRAPQYNQIVHNIFDYGGGRPSQPAIFIGSRDDIPLQLTGVKKYCNDDLDPSGRPYPGNDTPLPFEVSALPNSSESNDDWAGHNVVAQNRFTALRGQHGLGDLVKLSSRAQRLDTNYVDRNGVVADVARAVGELRRPAGCAVHDGIVNGYTPFIVDGVVIDIFEQPRPPIRLVCGAPLACRNGNLVPAPARSCSVRDLVDDCRIGGVNRDCTARATCPTGTRLYGVQAACNLEYGAVSDAALDRVPMHRIEVVRQSTNVDEGRCWANGAALSEGRARILDARVGDSVAFGCREHDRNGADCHVRVRFYCSEPR